MSEFQQSVEAFPFLFEVLRSRPCPACRVEVVIEPDAFGKPQIFRPIGYTYVMDAATGTMVQRTAFVRHSCPEMAEWQRRLAEDRAAEDRRRAKERRHLVSEENRLRREANLLDREQQTAQANQVACPKCGVGPGQPCENLMERRHGTRARTVWPHGERIIAATSGLSRPDVGAQIEREGGIS